MKISKIEKVCRKNKSVCLEMDTEKGGQWIGDSAARYLVEGMPELSMRNVCAMFDLDKEKQEKWYLNEDYFPEFFDTSLTTDGDETVKERMFLYSIKGEPTLAMMTNTGRIITIREKYIDPVEAEATEIVIRKAGDIEYAVINRGFLPIAVVPLAQALVGDKNGFEAMRMLAEDCMEQLETLEQRAGIQETML